MGRAERGSSGAWTEIPAGHEAGLSHGALNSTLEGDAEAEVGARMWGRKGRG